jgi:hypothetical protein
VSDDAVAKRYGIVINVMRPASNRVYPFSLTRISPESVGAGDGIWVGKTVKDIEKVANSANAGLPHVAQCNAAPASSEASDLDISAINALGEMYTGCRSAARARPSCDCADGSRSALHAPLHR